MRARAGRIGPKPDAPTGGKAQRALPVTEIAVLIRGDVWTARAFNAMGAGIVGDGHGIGDIRDVQPSCRAGQQETDQTRCDGTLQSRRWAGHQLLKLAGMMPLVKSVKSGDLRFSVSQPASKPAALFG